MKKLFGIILTLAAAATVQAQSLAFTSGAITYGTNVTLELRGPSNLICRLERFNPTTLAWDNLNNVTLDTNGDATVMAGLFNNTYGVFRSQATNGTCYSTNAFGATVGYVPGGKCLLGNPFGPVRLTNIFFSLENFTTVQQWNNASNRYESATYLFGAWDKMLTVDSFTSFILESPSNSWNRFEFSGLFTTNAETVAVPMGFSLLCSPLLLPLATNAWTVDILTTNQLGGASFLPVETPWSNPQSTLYRAIDPALNYQVYTLTTNNLWLSDSNFVEVPLGLNEGFWLNKPTNATWTIQRPIW